MQKLYQLNPEFRNAWLNRSTYKFCQDLSHQNYMRRMWNIRKAERLCLSSVSIYPLYPQKFFIHGKLVASRGWTNLTYNHMGLLIHVFTLIRPRRCSCTEPLVSHITSSCLTLSPSRVCKNRLSIIFIQSYFTSVSYRSIYLPIACHIS